MDLLELLFLSSNHLPANTMHTSPCSIVTVAHVLSRSSDTIS